MNLLMAPRKWMVVSAFALLAGAPPALRAQPPQPAATAPGPAAEVRVVNRKAEGGVRTLRARRGETVTLTIRADEKLVVHVHGYDVHQAVEPGTAASLVVTARYVGRFPVTAHLSGAASGRHGPEPTLLYLEVHPE